jgi:poly-gamma-glutamate synthesis protein (capsule biosynthesis protein)
MTDRIVSDAGSLFWQRNEGGHPALRIAAVGDIQLSASIADTIVAGGPAAPFGDTLHALCAADLRIGHLEFLFSRDFKAFTSHSEPFTGARPQMVSALTAVGFDALSIATNHAMDWGPEAIQTTRTILKENSIACTGAGLDAADSEVPVVLTHGGLRIALVSYCKHGAFSARTDRPGAADMNRSNVSATIERLRQSVDHIIVSFHWGVEFCPYPRPEDRRLAIAAIEAGATAVLGHHPHVVQGIEIYHGRPIFYSLGSFLYNPDDERAKVTDAMDRRTLSLIAELELVPDGVVALRALPVRFDPEDCRLRMLSGPESEKACTYIRNLSDHVDQPGLVFHEAAVGNLLRREIKNFGVLWRRDGFRFLWRFFRDLKLRHVRMLAGFLAAKALRGLGLSNRPKEESGGRKS